MTNDTISYLGLEFSFSSGLASLSGRTVDVQSPTPHNPLAPRQRGKLLQVLIEEAENGLTLKQLSAAHNIKIATAQSNIRELRLKVSDLIVGEDFNGTSLILSDRIFIEGQSELGGLLLRLNTQLLKAIQSGDGFQGVRTEPHHQVLMDGEGNVIEEANRVKLPGNDDKEPVARRKTPKGSTKVSLKPMPDFSR